MNLSMGNKNVVVGLVVPMLYLSMSFFIERTSAMHQFHEKAAAVVVDTKGSSSLLDHQVVDVKRGPAYRKGGIFSPTTILPLMCASRTPSGKPGTT